ncbi:gas vesicle protein [Streptomyces sp. HUAS ZL42]|uniref:gas vesicle protein n=1 Tax=Streptomyces sp. HUAS ZL42 TaxID=3231715 RepID=UPI00345E64C9
MTQSDSGAPTPSRSLYPYGQGSGGANLADILERVLDKGIVIVGDIKINLLDIELLTIKLRLLVASVDKAKEIGIDWWEHDPALSSMADGRRSLKEQNERLRAEVKQLRRQVEESRPELAGDGSTERRRPRETERSRGTERSRETERKSRTEPRRKRRRAEDADDEADDEDRSRGP